MELKAAELGIEIDKAAMADVVDELKRLEHAGYHFEVADDSPPSWPTSYTKSSLARVSRMSE